MRTIEVVETNAHVARVDRGFRNQFRLKMTRDCLGQRAFADLALILLEGENMRVTKHRHAIRTEFDAFGAPDLALQLQFSGGSESMGHHHSGFDDWWSVGRRCATLWASLLRQTEQRIRPLFT